MIFPPIGAALGIGVTDVLCAAVSAWAFDLLVCPRFARAGRIGSLAFAVGTLVQVAVGRVPFLLGQSLALLALLALRRRGPAWGLLGVALALAATLASPLAGLFFALAALAWFLGELPRWSFWVGASVVVASLPVAALELLFPGQGRMPFAVLDFAGTLIPLAALIVLLRHRERTLRIGLALYALLTIGSYAIPTALGVNVTRLATSVGVGLALCLAARSLRSRLLLALALVPLVLGQWVPSRSALLAVANPARSAAYFEPLLAYLVPHDHPLGRIEVVPLSTHWESDYVALRLPLARGWERQLDTADNPIFYDAGRLFAGSYRRWLAHNGVRFVALADAPLDYAGIAEARLVSAGVPGLKLVWRSAHWRVYEVLGAPGIVSGAGSLVSERGDSVVLRAQHPGRLLVRIRYLSSWRVASGDASLRASSGGWLAVGARRAGRIVLSLSW